MTILKICGTVKKLRRIKPNKKIQFLKNGVLLLMTVIAFLVILEILLRIFFPQNLNITRVDSDKIFELKPNIASVLRRQEFKTHVKINSQGLRDKEYELKKPDNTVRIAVVGDSFVFGFGVELNETIVKILESKLNSRLSKKRYINYEVMNFGVSAYGTEQEYILIKNKVITYSPNIIILAFVPNDFKENVKFNLFDVKNGALIRNPPQKITSLLKLRNYISWHSHLYSLVYSSIIDNQKLRDFFIKAKLLNPPYKNPNTDFDSLIYLNSKNQEFDYTVNKTLFLLNAINNIAKKNNIELVIFLVPTREQVDNNKMKDYIKSNKLPFEKLNITKVQEIIMAVQKENVIIIDPLDLFNKYNKNNTFYYNVDGHWNAKGHQFAADILYEKLINMGIVS